MTADESPSMLTIRPDANRMLVNIKADGTIEYGEGYTPDETARVLWETIAAEFPNVWQDAARRAGWDPPVSGDPEPDLGADLSDLWSAETCGWHIDYDAGAHVAWPWTVVLEWSSERGNEHSADWVTYTWQVYGETVDQALGLAIEWCEGLLPWAECEACGGSGSWNGREPCDECQGTGLANHG